MKMTVSRLFEAGAVLDAFQKAKVEGIEGFVTFLSDFSENVIRGMRGQLTFLDNFFYEERTVDLLPGISQALRLSKARQARLVLVGKSTPFANPITSWNWQMRLDGQLEVAANFMPPADTGKISVTFCIFY